MFFKHVFSFAIHNFASFLHVIMHFECPLYNYIKDDFTFKMTPCCKNSIIFLCIFMHLCFFMHRIPFAYKKMQELKYEKSFFAAAKSRYCKFFRLKKESSLHFAKMLFSRFRAFFTKKEEPIAIVY